MEMYLCTQFSGHDGLCLKEKRIAQLESALKYIRDEAYGVFYIENGARELEAYCDAELASESGKEVK
jgi:hypothetical protein